MEHFENSPHSLLVKILGAYSIQQSFPRRKKVGTLNVIMIYNNAFLYYSD